MNDLSIVVRKMCVYAEHRSAGYGLGFPELVIIMYLAENGDSNQEQIARYFELDKGAISKTIAKLEAKGLVTREVNPDSKREKLVALQPAADPVLLEMRAVFSEWQEAVLAGVSEQERDIMMRTLARMAANSTDMLQGER